jgi:hypothetical protein
MTAAVIAFGAARSRRARDRLALDRTGERRRLGVLDEELRTVEHAIASLRRRRVSVLARYRAEFRRVGEAEKRAN